MRKSKMQRRFERVPYRGTVALWQGRQPHVITVSDLSAGGVFISTKVKLGEGSLHTLRLSLPGEPGFTVLGRVVRNQAGRPFLRPGGVALEFVDIAPKDRARLGHYIDRIYGAAA